MNWLNLTVHLRVVGVLLLLLVVVNLFLPKRFAWAAELARLSLLTRQVFLVHWLFILLVLGLMGVLSLGFATALLERTQLATLVLGGLALFWLVRLAVQFLVYSPQLWRGHRFNTAMHVLFSVLWTYFTLVYAAAWAVSRR